MHREDHEIWEDRLWLAEKEEQQHFEDLALADENWQEEEYQRERNLASYLNGWDAMPFPVEEIE